MGTNLTEAELLAQEEELRSATKSRTVTLTLEVSEKALHQVRAGFNPDRILAVGRYHLICAALITALDEIRNRDKPALIQGDIPASKLWAAIDDGARQAALAITHIETACMYAVKAATAELYADKNFRRDV
jgi:hypothetical protein